jgi:hypothetical protein
VTQAQSPPDLSIGYARGRTFVIGVFLAAMAVGLLVLVVASPSSSGTTHAAYGLFGGLMAAAAWAVFRLATSPVLIVTRDGVTGISPTAPKDKRAVSARWEDVTGLVVRSGYRQGPTLCVYAREVEGNPPLAAPKDLPGATTVAMVSVGMLPKGLDLVAEMNERAARRGVSLPGVLKRDAAR